MTAPVSPLQVLIVDDEPLARARLRNLLADCDRPAAVAAGEAANVAQALALARQRPFDVALLDIHMPGHSGLDLADALRRLPAPPQIVFVTAHAEYALQAFELQAADYLTKPVRLERLQTALEKAARLAGRFADAATPAQPPPPSPPQPPTEPQPQQDAAADDDDWLLVPERQGALRLPVRDVLYFKAELKYITVRTAQGEHLLHASLGDLAARYGERFVRIHRNTLVARHAIRALLRQTDAAEGEVWAVRLAGIDELLPVSRRQLAPLRQALGQG